MAEQMNELQLLFQEKLNTGTAWTRNESFDKNGYCLLYTSPSPRDATLSRMPSSA